MFLRVSSATAGQLEESRVEALHFELLLTLTVAVCFLKPPRGGAQSNAGVGGVGGKRGIVEA